MSSALSAIFPDSDYRFRLRFERGSPSEFFGGTADCGRLLAERRQWLRSDPKKYSALLPSGAPLLAEASRCAQQWNGFEGAAVDELNASAALVALGEFWEADYLLLKADEDDEIRLYGGCVCFPSSWQLEEKLGKPIEFIHGPVPGLNGSLGPAIHKFLANLGPGTASFRDNWGLARSAELNHHPSRTLPRLDAHVSLSEVWVRVERQALVALPGSGGILFGIRVVNYPLADIKKEPGLRAGLRRALETMPAALAVYKGIALARERLLELLED